MMIKFEDVKQSYSGKPGCMCGCRGKYAIASHFGVEAANKAAGYEAYDACSDRSVKSTITKLNRLINWNDPKAVAEHVEADCAWFLTDTRNYVVYFTDSSRGCAIRELAALPIL